MYEFGSWADRERCRTDLRASGSGVVLGARFLAGFAVAASCAVVGCAAGSPVGVDEVAGVGQPSNPQNAAGGNQVTGGSMAPTTAGTGATGGTGGTASNTGGTSGSTAGDVAGAGGSGGASAIDTGTDAGIDAAVVVIDDRCADGMKNGFESDTDCGGPDCAPCPDGDTCVIDSDCQVGTCTSSICGVDQCPSDAAKTAPGACGCGNPDTDSDSDGTADCIDGCPSDSSKVEAGACGCGVSEGADADSDGTPDCTDGCVNDPNKVAAGVCGCGVSDVDTDSDGTPDCNDGCPEDGFKTSAGQCGCGFSDADSDADGVSDCDDGCPSDPDRTTVGTCGCVGGPSPAAAGTPCSDGVCPLSSVCDGAGSCGSASDCTPPHSSCGALETYNGHGYYFCTAGQSWQNARDICRSQAGLDLVHIDNAAENTFVDGNLVSTTWIGGNDQSVEGVWRWSDDDSQFWSGDSGGFAVTYANWGSGEPNNSGGEHCAEMGTNGNWNDQTCSTSRDFVCETRPNLCPDDPFKYDPGQCGCGYPDTDTDTDGSADCVDGCVEDPAKTAPGTCGCGASDGDSDGDGWVDCQEECPFDGTKQSPGVCGCGQPDDDYDGDGVLDCNDSCPVDASNGPQCFGYIPANFNATTVNFDAAPDATLDCGTTTIDTTGTVTITNWCGPVPVPVIQAQTGGPSVVIIPLSGLSQANGHTLRLIGDKPVIFAVRGDATLDGLVDASAVGSTPGAGGNVSCDLSTGRNGTGSSSAGGGGGGGGGYGTVGGNGGYGDNNGNQGAAGVSRGDPALEPLVGGCGGGVGGGCSNAGGAGGGAIQLSVSGTLTLVDPDNIHANGGDGINGCGSEGGGSGGGSGGAILLQAAGISSSGLALSANGGSGGNGSSGGSGGAGSTSAASAGTNGQYDSADGGGGGGGGYGRIRID
ncbi:MAG: hypothetical protein OEZ06_29135 [Myxococcales bacterium]|nr:hypothetical protein [Myxococcales bacterium]